MFILASVDVSTLILGTRGKPNRVVEALRNRLDTNQLWREGLQGVQIRQDDGDVLVVTGPTKKLHRVADSTDMPSDIAAGVIPEINYKAYLAAINHFQQAQAARIANDDSGKVVPLDRFRQPQTKH